MKKNKRQILLITLSGLAIYFACSLLSITSSFGIRRNLSESLPYTYFLSTPFREVKRNQYVSFAHPTCELQLAKRIVGIAGDAIAYRNNHIFLNDKDYGEMLPHTTSGLPLTPLSEGIIPDGFVFVHAPHRESFDSRYQEFGLIQVAHLKETLWPIY